MLRRCVLLLIEISHNGFEMEKQINQLLEAARSM
jgi:hypothetical protein